MAEILKPNDIQTNSAKCTSSEDIYYEAHFAKVKVWVNLMDKEAKEKTLEWLKDVMTWLKRRAVHKP